MALRLARPDQALLARGTPFMRLLVDAADRLGGLIELETEYGFLGRYTAPDGTRRPLFGKSLGLNRDSAAAIAVDKDYTARLLATSGLPAPEGVLIFGDAYRHRMALKNRDVADRLPGIAAALGFARRIGFPVIVKPNSGSEGYGITLARSEAALTVALGELLQTEDRVRIECHVPGRDYRLLVFDGHVRLAYERRPLMLTGDGQSSIADLLDAVLAGLASRHRGAKLSANDPRIAETLRAAGMDLPDTLAMGQELAVLDNANLSTGGSLRDLTGLLPPDVEALAIRAADTLGLRVAGVDVLAPDLMAGPTGAVVLEVNSAPGVDYYASESEEHYARVRDLITDMLAAGG